MSREIANYELTAALDDLEQRLEMPVVPGELEEWATALREEFAKVDAPLRVQQDEMHPKQFDEISAEDPALVNHVEEMREADIQLRNAHDELADRIMTFHAQAVQQEPDEKHLDQEREALVEDALKFVIAARKQEAAVDTWFVEAMQRDRGDVD